MAKIAVFWSAPFSEMRSRNHIEKRWLFRNNCKVASGIAEKQAVVKILKSVCVHRIRQGLLEFGGVK